MCLNIIYLLQLMVTPFYTLKGVGLRVSIFLFRPCGNCFYIPSTLNHLHQTACVFNGPFLVKSIQEESKCVNYFELLDVNESQSD